MKGIILKNQNGYFSIAGEGEQLTLCRSRGRLKRKTDILVGDAVEYETGLGSEGVITRVYPRKNALHRPPVANVDQLVLVSAALRENNQAQALVCINGVCNSCRDETWKPYYQALRFFLVRLHERKEHPRRLPVAAQEVARGRNGAPGSRVSTSRRGSCCRRR